MFRRIFLFTRLVRPTFATLTVVLRLAIRLSFLVIRTLLAGLAVWIRGIPDSCRQVAGKWEQEAMMAGVGTLSRPIYFLMYVLTFIEIVVVSLALAHIVVFAIFAAVLFL
jgi:hypothetical protein